MANYEQDSGVSEAGDDAPRENPQQKRSIDEENDKDAEATILIPKKAMGGKEFKPGDEIVFEIVADHGEEMSAKYATEGDSDHEESADSELDTMSKGTAPNEY